MTNEKRTFAEQGFVMVPGLLPPGCLEALKADLDAWTEASRSYSENFGFDTPDGKARFDLQPGHSADQPMLRRVANPADISEAYQNALFQGPVLEKAKDLIGPDIRFHHSKINTKAPGAETKVDWHQDHAFTPLSNPDMVTVLILLDDMTPENGCLRIVPGSHKTPRSHFQDGRFVGKISDDVSHHAGFDAEAVDITGRAGDVCYMHTWAVHGGGHNQTVRARSLLILDYMAADAVPLAVNPIPSRFTGKLLAGIDLKTARLVAADIELPAFYDDDSFFGLQEAAAQ